MIKTKYKNKRKEKHHGLARCATNTDLSKTKCKNTWTESRLGYTFDKIKVQVKIQVKGLFRAIKPIGLMGHAQIFYREI